MEILHRIWQTYPILIDLLLYFFVFAAAARVAFAKVFPGHSGKVLSVAVGLFLAASLAVAQRAMGFSLERIGPIAVFILCGILFIAAYRFLQSTETPKPVIILICGLLVLALLRAALPNATAAFARNNPLTLMLILGSLIYWAWHSSEGYASKMFSRQPGQVLSKNQVVPDEKTLKSEKKFIKKRLRDTTKEDQKEEQQVRNELEKAIALLGKERLTENTRPKILELLNQAQKKSTALKEKTARLFQIDDALKRFDTRWFKKTHSVDFGHLTLEQQEVIKRSLHEERKRMQVEERLKELEQNLHQRLEGIDNCIAQARRALAAMNAAGAIGWMNKAIQEQSALQALEKDTLMWEKWLIRLVNKQLQTIE